MKKVNLSFLGFVYCLGFCLFYDVSYHLKAFGFGNKFIQTVKMFLKALIAHYKLIELKCEAGQPHISSFIFHCGGVIINVRSPNFHGKKKKKK